MARNLGAAAATAEVRTPGPLQCLIFRSQPEPARPLERYVRPSAVAKVLALARQSPVAAAPRVRTRRALLLLAAPVFFVAWASLLLVPTSIPHFSSFCRRSFSCWISSSRFLVSVLGCGVASFSALEISLAWEWTRRVCRPSRTDRAGFLH